ncbi:MAG: MoaD family protein [Chloroflexi bacterium]|jgi:molybdopterin synthase sulfur carrier subunit|nr:MoaD family protein [Chloroflexota bacterium]
MAVQVRVPPLLREAVGGARLLEGSGDTVDAVLQDIDRRHPGFRERLIDEHGALRRFVNVYVNDEDIRYLNKLATPVRDGDTVSILPSVAGGGG